MRLAPREIEKLMLHNAGFLAQKRYARGVVLNYVETVALISTQLLEFIRDGKTVAQLMEQGKRILGLDDVMPGVSEMLHEVQVEGTFPDGTKLVTIHYPISNQKGDSALALYGSFLTKLDTTCKVDNSSNPHPGEVICQQGDIVLNNNKKTVTVNVLNHGDRPVQVGSHYCFFEVNGALQFDRRAAFGMRLNIPAGTAVRFEPGETKEVLLVEIGGEKIVRGGNNLTDGKLSELNIESCLSEAINNGYNHKEESNDK